MLLHFWIRDQAGDEYPLGLVTDCTLNWRTNHFDLSQNRALDFTGAAALWAGFTGCGGESDWIHQIGSALCRILLLIDLAGSITRAARLRLGGFFTHPLIITETIAQYSV
jgi:hypothetical protein